MIRYRSLSTLSRGWRNAIVHLKEQRQCTLHHVTNNASTLPGGTANSRDCVKQVGVQQNIRPCCCEDRHHQDTIAKSNLHLQNSSVHFGNPRHGFNGYRTSMTDQETRSDDSSVPEDFSHHQQLRSFGDRASASCTGFHHMPTRSPAIAAAMVVAAAPSEVSEGFGPVVGAMQLMDGLHSVTSLPWWATLSVAAVGELTLSQLLSPTVFLISDAEVCDIFSVSILDSSASDLKVQFYANKEYTSISNPYLQCTVLHLRARIEY